MSQPPTAGGGPQPPVGNRKARLSVILAVAGLLCFPVLSIVAIVLGSRSRKEIRASGGLESGDGQAQAAIVLGIVGCVLWGAGLAFYAILLVVGNAAGS